MRILISGSMTFAKEMIAAGAALSSSGHQVVLPKDAELYARGQVSTESSAKKVEEDLFHYYFREVEASDAILILNYTKKGIANYIGGNALIEMAFAHVLGKKIFVLNPLPELSYSDELKALQPQTILHGDLAKI